MRTFFSSVLLALFQTALFCQTAVPVTFIIEDEDSHKSLSGVLVSIKQTGYDTKSTDASGKVSFSNVPVGQIDFNIIKEGYQMKTGRENVSSEIKNNTFRYGIQKIPTADDKKILVTGEVTDAEGNDIKDVWVEVKIADVVRTVMTDESGNYTLDITPNPKFPATSMRVEVKKGTCKKTEVIDLNRTNLVYRDFKLECVGGKPAVGGGGDKPDVEPPKKGPLGEKTLSGENGSIKMTIDRFEQKGSTAIFFFTLENMTRNKTILETGIWTIYNELIDQEGNSYESNYMLVGNAQAGKGNGASFKLIANNPVKGSIQFDVGAVQVKKAGLLKVWFSGYSSDSDTIEFTNLPIK